MKHILTCSFGKDSIATALLALQHGEPLDELVYSEVMFSDNLIIYGHNMKDGSMFADLAKYRSKDFWQTHKTVWFDTALGSCAYEIFAVIHTTVQADAADAFAFYLFVDAAAPEEFADYVSVCKSWAMRSSTVPASSTWRFGTKTAKGLCGWTVLRRSFLNRN